MESICEGWLIKSPPEKRTQGRWKLFRAKWRRRYFVLYAPPAVDIIPGMCAAILDYYGGKNLRHKHGTIDLTHCEEVLSQLDASFYQNVFGLRTKHKSRDRTYYLVAETEAVMNEWVNSLCFVLGMKENIQDSVSSSTSGSLSQPSRASLPSPSASSLFSSVSSLPAPRCETLPVPHRSGGRRVLSHTRVQSLPGINETANTEMEEWQGDVPTSRLRPPPPSAPPVVGSRDSHMTMRFVPPLPVTGSGQRHSCIVGAMSDRPQIFTDSLLLGQATNDSSVDGSNEYDHPRQSYYHKIPSCDVNCNSFSGNATNFSDGFYNVPSRNTDRTPEQDILYKIPPSRSKNYLYSDDIKYDVPTNARHSYDVPVKCLEQHTVNGEHYDVPPAGVPAPYSPSGCQSESGRNGATPADVSESSHLLSVLQNLINELPSVDSAENHLVKPPMYCNWDVQRGGALEGKVSPRELLMLSPPVPGKNNLPQHPYINTGNGEIPSGDVSSSMQFQNFKPVNLSRHPAYNQVPTANDPICFTHRSRSFKRTVECTDGNKPLALPMKRISDVDETSSVSDDDESCSVSNSDCSTNEPTTPLKPSIYDIVPLPTQKDLGCSPAISKESQIIKYLDLDLEPNSAAEKPSSPGKLCDALDSKQGVIQYKEIDWCKTKALTETRRDVENKRRMGERTLGD